MADKPWVYIASPYTKGDPAINVRFQHEVFDELLNWGMVVPFAPLISHYHHIVHPRPYDYWIEYDLELLKRFDCLLRVNVIWEWYFCDESSGADQEAAFMQSMGKKVCYSIDSLKKWVTNSWPEILKQRSVS